MLYVAIGIIGRHRHAAQPLPALGPGADAASFQQDEASIRTAIRFNTIDSAVALTIAFLVNAAILVLAAMVFYGKEQRDGGGRRGGHASAPTATGSASPT